MQQKNQRNVISGWSAVSLQIQNKISRKLNIEYLFEAVVRRCRSSRPEVFYKIGVLKNLAKFIGKHLCQSLFFNKNADVVCNYIKKETLAQVFFCEFCEIFKNTFFYRTPSVTTSELAVILG